MTNFYSFPEWFSNMPLTLRTNYCDSEKFWSSRKYENLFPNGHFKFYSTDRVLIYLMRVFSLWCMQVCGKGDLR